MPRLKSTDIVRFRKSIVKSRTCWNWSKSKFRDGYGQMCVGRKNMKAHRVSYLIHKGQIPDGFLVMHICDNPSCVRPSHLTLGTNADNMKDRNLKRRHAYGEKNGACVKMNEEKVRQLRVDRASGRYKVKELSAKYNISMALTEKILSRSVWKHL